MENVKDDPKLSGNIIFTAWCAFLPIPLKKMKHLLFHLTYLCIAGRCYCQTSTSIALSSGISYVHKKGIDAQYSAVYSPGAGFQLAIPVADKVSVIVGAGYQQKGFHDISTSKSVRTKTEYIVDAMYHYLYLPLMASYNVCQNKHLKLWWDGGMGYNFYLKGKRTYQINSYYNDQLIDQTVFTSPVKSGLTYSNYNYKTYGRTSAMDASIKLQLRLVLYRHYLLAIYHDHSLYDISVSGGQSGTVKLRSTGASIGYIF